MCFLSEPVVIAPSPHLAAQIRSSIHARPRRRALCCLAFIGSLLISASLASAQTSFRPVTLAWDANTEADLAGYKLRYGTASGIYDQTLDVGNTTTASVSNLLHGTAYFFVVSAYNTAGMEGPPSDEARVLSDNANLLSLELSAGTLTPAFDSGTGTYTTYLSDSTANLTLFPTAADAAATVTVNGSLVASGSASPAIPLNTGGNTISIVVTAPDGRTTRTYTLTATRAVGIPGVFTLSNLTPVWNPAPPGAPAVQLTWTDSTNATTYDLYRDGLPYLSRLTATSFYDNAGLAAGRTYSYHVIARNSSATRQSNTVSVGPMPAPPPSIPGSLTLTSDAPYWNDAAGAPAVNLAWTASANATAYDLYRNGSIHAANLAATQLSFLNDTNLAAGQSYSYYVTARNAAGSTQSNSILLAMPAVPKVAARMTSPAPGSMLPSSTVTFAWGAGTGVSQYSLWVGTGSGTGTTASNLYSGNQTGLSRTVKGLPTDGRAIYVTLRSLIDGVWQSRLYTYTAYARPKVLVLLHGLNTSPSASSPGGWDPLLAALQFPDSPIIYNGKTTSTASASPHRVFCYRVMFGRKDATTTRKGLEGISANSSTRPPTAFAGYYSGDFETLTDLGSEVGDAISCVLAKHPQAQITLLAHGRGGLAARSFLQSTTSNATAKSAVVALHTVATPHSGTVLAKFHEYLSSRPRLNAAEADNWAVVDALKENMSQGIDLRRPTTGDLNPSGIVVSSLNSNLGRLPKISYVSQIYSGVDLGWLAREIKQTPTNYSIFQGPADGITPAKSVSQTAAAYILGAGKSPSDYPGDGFVPASSQALPTRGLTSGINPKTFTYSKNVYHAEEPAQTSDIISVLNQAVPWWPAVP